MEIKIKCPSEATAPFQIDHYYQLEITQIRFNISQKLHEHKIKDKNKYLVEGYEHSKTDITLNGVLTAKSDFIGDDLEEKKDNLIKAASEWWMAGDARQRTKSAQLYWRGWEQYIMIERLEFMKVAGEVESYEYDLTVIVHEGA